jgi:hypothetical protein
MTDIFIEALKLHREARAALNGSLLDSLDKEVDEKAEFIWETEILKHIRDIEKGTAKTVPWPEGKRQLAGL